MDVTRCDDGVCIVERSAGARALAAGLALACLVSVVGVICLTIRAPEDGFSIFVALLSCCMMVPLSILFLRSAGPLRVVIDTSRKTYTFTAGFPWRIRTSAGLFADMKPPSVRKEYRARGGGPPMYHVTLGWNIPGRPEIRLTASELTMEWAERQAVELRAKLGFACPDVAVSHEGRKQQAEGNQK